MSSLTTQTFPAQTFYKSAFGELLAVQIAPQIQLLFTYNLPVELMIASVTAGGTVTSSPPFAVLASSMSSSAYFRSNNHLHYRTGQGVSCVFSCLFTQGIVNNSQYLGIGNAVDGFFFGYDGSTFGILYRNNSVDTWIFQASWSIDSFDGNGPSGLILDPTLGNIYRVQYQWEGFGNVNFFIENPNTGGFYLVHQLQYLNLNTNTSLTNPTLPLYAMNTSGNSAATSQMQIPCMAAFLEGKATPDNKRYAVLGTSFVSSGLVLAVQNNLLYNGFINRKVLLPDFSSLAVTGATTTRFDYIINPTITGAAFLPVGSAAGFSVASFSVTASSVTGGRTLFSYYIGGNASDNILLSQSNFSLNPGDILVIQAAVGNSVTVSATLSWAEQF